MFKGFSEKRLRKLEQAFFEEEIPSWVNEFPGPFQSLTKQEIVNKWLRGDNPRMKLHEWVNEYTNEGLGNLVVPSIRFEEMTPVVDYMVMIGDLDDTARMAVTHVSKDPRLFPFPQHNVVNTPDIHSWRAQRGSIADAFLPRTNLAKTTPIVDAHALSWCDRLKKIQGGVVDMKDELLHTALCIYIHSLLGVSDPFDKPFDEVKPDDSARVRNIFNLELKFTKDRLIERMTFGKQFVDSLLSKGLAADNPTPLVQSLAEMEDIQARDENMMALLVAGHDTTAYTMQFLLFEFARNPEYQIRAREESIKFYQDLDNRGGQIQYSDLNKLTFLRRCITESLRLWNVATTVFTRVCSTAVEVKGKGEKKVKLPKGTSFNFWYFGQHHAESLWGSDSLVFNPDREFQNHELQRGERVSGEPDVVAFTPATERFHPFSLPRRDCLGKNFAFLEMRVLMSRLLTQFNVELAEPTLSEATVKVGSGDIYGSWLLHANLAQPDKMMFKLTELTAQSKM